MFNIFIIKENFTNGYNDYILNLLFFLVIFCGILVITSKNPVVSVLYLIGLFLNISIYIIFLGITFIGISYLLVYIGAVSILFLFILMLINIRVSELITENNNSIPLGILIGIFFIISLTQVLHNDLFNNNYDIYNISDNNNIDISFNTSIKHINTNEYILFVSSKLWDGNIAEVSHITSIGNIMYTSYSIWLIITSLILLLAMIGAIIITIK